MPPPPPPEPPMASSMPCLLRKLTVPCRSFRRAGASAPSISSSVKPDIRSRRDITRPKAAAFCTSTADVSSSSAPTASSRLGARSGFPVRTYSSLSMCLASRATASFPASSLEARASCAERIAPDPSPSICCSLDTTRNWLPSRSFMASAFESFKAAVAARYASWYCRVVMCMSVSAFRKKISPSLSSEALDRVNSSCAVSTTADVLPAAR
mmetsp:Transcript_55019/g.154759  ORF Transcript_55019/g.154759 Transcript_55019/m.154759 type:complete len:211 (-) Transcript_55019:680-1312(-)